MCTKHSFMKNFFLPTFYLRHLKIKVAEKETYLRYIIDTDISDDDHIIKFKEIRNIYTRGNMLIQSLSTAQITLF